jgi:hypothetical protein
LAAAWRAFPAAGATAQLGWSIQLGGFGCVREHDALRRSYCSGLAHDRPGITWGRWEIQFRRRADSPRIRAMAEPVDRWARRTASAKAGISFAATPAAAKQRGPLDERTCPAGIISIPQKDPPVGPPAVGSPRAGVAKRPPIARRQPQPQWWSGRSSRCCARG